MESYTRKKINEQVTHERINLIRTIDQQMRTRNESNFRKTKKTGVSIYISIMSLNVNF